MTDTDKINQIVCNSARKSHKNALSFFSESDLQTVLSMRLRLEFKDEFETSVKRGPLSNPKSTKKYRTGLLSITNMGLVKAVGWIS